MHLDKVVSTKDAQARIRAGVKKLSDAVAPTLGPFGSNGLLEKGLKVTNDGISIAKEIQLEDEIEDLALRKAREASERANEKAGDGSTTTILLTHKTLESVSQATGSGIVKKRPTQDVLRQVSREKDEIIGKLKDMAHQIESEEELIDSATVSLEDRTIGEILGKAQWKLGKDGVLVPELTTDTGVSVEFVSGIRIDNGLGAMQVVTNQEKEALEVENVPVLLTTHIIDSIAPFEEMVATLAKKGARGMVVIARAYSEQAIQQIMALGGNGFQIFPVNAPYVNQREVMKDLKAVMGGTFLDTEDSTLADIQLSDLGYAKRIFARRWDAVFTGVQDEHSEERIAKRVSELKQKLAGEVSAFEQKAIETRIAQLTSGFGLVKVGAVSDTERKRLFDKIEDACNAVRAAMQEGVVPGAGLAFKEIAEGMSEESLLKQPLLSVNEQVMANAPSDFVIEDWVKDPVLVLRTSLEQAVSVAADLATVETAVHVKWDRHTCKGE